MGSSSARTSSSVEPREGGGVSRTRIGSEPPYSSPSSKQRFKTFEYKTT